MNIGDRIPGIMRGKEVNIQIIEGTYNIVAKMVFALWK